MYLFMHAFMCTTRDKIRMCVWDAPPRADDMAQSRPPCISQLPSPQSPPCLSLYLTSDLLLHAFPPLSYSVSEDVKISLLATLANWLPRLGPTSLVVPPAASAQLLVCLRDASREALRRAAARCALQAVRSQPALAGSLLLPGGSGSVPETCLKWVSDALSKPALRLDGVLGALMVARALEAAGPCGRWDSPYGD